MEETDLGGKHMKKQCIVAGLALLFVSLACNDSWAAGIHKGLTEWNMSGSTTLGGDNYTSVNVGMGRFTTNTTEALVTLAFLSAKGEGNATSYSLGLAQHFGTGQNARSVPFAYANWNHLSINGASDSWVTFGGGILDFVTDDWGTRVFVERDNEADTTTLNISLAVFK